MDSKSKTELQLLPEQKQRTNGSERDSSIPHL
jgi:hypothetical protein